MRIIFCADYWNSRSVDEAFEAEANVVERLQINYSLIDIEALVEQRNAQRAVRKVDPASSEEVAIYRGWMLKPHAYAQLFAALAERGLALINTPAAYTHCHYLPESYHLIEGFTPRSTWIRTGPDVAMDEVMKILQPFGDRAVVVKDFVKSRKHEWNEACYISCASDRNAVERVVRRFLQLQGEDLNEGLVFREFIEFEPLTSHSKSGMPLVKEYRLFVLDGKIILSAPYWEEGDYGDNKNGFPPIDVFRHVAQKIQSRFFTLDVARKRDGVWNIVEPGDGQVAGLPARADVQAFYQALSRLSSW
ncbi:MAG: ATP-grasp domain-containing protein [Ktedonobacteraceae bacterium]|nr:ATP-grasp domain-containing protein [Ktedonobacteraceae bacterium]